MARKEKCSNNQTIREKFDNAWDYIRNAQIPNLRLIFTPKRMKRVYIQKTTTAKRRVKDFFSFPNDSASRLRREISRKDKRKL